MKQLFPIALLLCVSQVAFAQQGGQQTLDIIAIADQFIVSAAAVKKCAPPDETTEKAFLVNLSVVAIRKAQVLKERYPKLSEEQLAEQDKRRLEAVRTRAEQLIDQYGCQSEQVKQLIRRYKMQADWTIGAQ
jgi:hypothetical protein